MEHELIPTELLARRLRERSPQALEQMLDTHGPTIHAVAYSITGDYHAAEDITAETLVTAWKRIGSLRDDTRLRAWLITIASRGALQYLRRRSKEARNLATSLPSQGRVDDGLVTSMTLRDAMAELPDRMRTVITLHYLSDLSVDDIASAIGRSRNTVKTELRLGLQHLRRLLADSEL